MAFAQCSKSMDIIDKDAFIEYAKRFISEYDYIFYISPEGVDMEDNGVRETDLEYRQLIDFTIKMLVDTNKHRIQNFYTLSGSTEERVTKMISLIDF